MNYFWNTIQDNFGYTNLEIRRIQYFLKAIGGDISKLGILFFLYLTMGKTWEYLISVFVLLTLRGFSGGVHMKHYWSCLLCTLLVLSLSICILPMLPIPMYLAPVIICICSIITFVIGPIPSNRRPIITEDSWKKFRIKAITVLCVYLITSLLFPDYKYLDIVVWTIVVQTLQLILTNIFQKGDRYEKATG